MNDTNDMNDMNGMEGFELWIRMNREADKVNTIEEFIKFIEYLRSTFPQSISQDPYSDTNPWANLDIPMYLEAMQAWLQDYKKACEVSTSTSPFEHDPNLIKPGWNCFATLLLMGALYE